MKPLLIATTNPAKLAEYRLLLRGYDLAPLSLREAGLDDRAPEETGATFIENALLKARFYFARANLPTIADDGGLRWTRSAASPACDLIDGSPAMPPRIATSIARSPTK